jgi:hypothetical protein
VGADYFRSILARSTRFLNTAFRGIFRQKENFILTAFATHMLRSFFITIRPENFRTGVSPRSEAAWQRGWTIHPDHALNL